MPTYTFENKRTKKQKTEIMSIAARDQWLADNPDWFQVIIPLGVRDNFVASRHTNIPIDGEFRSLLKSIKANSGKDNTIDW